MPRDVFVSYHAEDRAWAERVSSALEGAHISYWIAPRDIPPGQEWAAAIVAGIKRSGSLVLIFSSHSSHSKQIAREIEMADRYHLNLVSLRVENVQPSESLEYYLHNIQWIDAFDGHFDQASRQLIATIQKGTNFPAERTEMLPAPDTTVPRKAAIVPPTRPFLARLGLAKALWAICIAVLLVLSLSYAVFVIRKPVSQDSGTIVESAGLLVAGAGADIYSVYDASGKQLLGAKVTGASFELFPGNYVVQLHGVKRPVSVRERQQTKLTSGTLVVAGTGADAYSVYPALGKELLGATTTDHLFELFPGDYTVELHSVRKPATVRDGQKTTVPSGTLVVAGSGSDSYSVYQAQGKQLLGATLTDHPFEFFPGDYEVELHGVRKPVKVRDGQKTTVPSGTLMVAGTGTSVYRVYDASGKQSLDARSTGVLLELLPGDYMVELQGIRKAVKVRPGQSSIAH